MLLEYVWKGYQLKKIQYWKFCELRWKWFWWQSYVKLMNIHVFSFIWPCNSLARCSDWADCDPIKVPWPQMTLHLPFFSVSARVQVIHMCSGPCQRPKLTNAISRWAIQLTTWRNQIHVKQLFKLIWPANRMMSYSISSLNMQQRPKIHKNRKIINSK